MKKVLLIPLCLLIATILQAQNLQLKWAEHMNGAGGGSGLSIATDAAGNVYTAGWFEGTVDFDPGPGIYNLTSGNRNSNSTMFLSKLDAAGNFVWVKQVGGDTLGNVLVASIALDANGNIYTTGRFAGKVDFDPGPCIFKLSSASWGESFVCKLDALGNLVWAKQLGGGGEAGEGGLSLAIDASGNVYTAGWFGYTRDFDPGPGIYNLYGGYNNIYVSKLDSAGNFIWARAPQLTSFGGIVEGIKLVLDAAGNVYCTGDFTGEVDFDPGPGIFTFTSLNSWNIYVWKLTARGGFVWAKQMTGIGNSRGVSIAVDILGTVITTGNFAGAVDFDPGTGTFQLVTLASQNNIYVSKLDTAGNFIWAKQMTGTGNSFSTAVTADAAGNVYLTGTLDNTVDIDPGTGTHWLTAGGYIDVFLSQYSPAGNFIWAKQMTGGDPTAYSVVGALKLDAFKNIYTTGYFKGTVDFDPGISTHNLTSSSTPGNDIFIQKISPCTGNTSASMTVTDCKNYMLHGKTYTRSGVYIQTILNSSGCDSIITLNLSINRINANSTSYATACNSYTWHCHVSNNCATSQCNTYYTSGVYTDTISAVGGCDSIIALNLTIINNKAAAAVSAVACNRYSWKGKTFTSSGSYNDTLVLSNGCDSIVTLDLTILPKSLSTIRQTICTGQTYSGYTNSGTYIDTLVASNGCDSIRTLHLTVLQKPAPDLGIDKDLCPGDSLVLNPGQYNGYLWQDGSSQSHFTAKQPGLYSVTVSDNCGSAKDEIVIRGGICDIYFPSAFTPNNDGKNDLFKIPNIYLISDYHLIVYTRWGQKVFETTNPSIGWNGQANGKPQNTGAFAWHCEFRKAGNADLVKMKGTVMLVR